MEYKKNQQPPYKRYKKVWGLEVSYDGKSARRENTNKTGYKYHYLKIQTDKEGNKFVRVDEGKLFVDVLVATCYCYCPPDYSRDTCRVIHKDGDKANCHRYNLQWVTPPEYRKIHLPEATQIDKSTGEKWVWAMYDMYVSEKGNVKIGDKVEKIEHLVSDSDLGCWRCVMPYVTSDEARRRFHVEELVADVFCPKPTDIANPVLLHIDNDMMNNEASNLKWVDSSDAAYIAFIEQWKKDKSAINLKYITLT